MSQIVLIAHNIRSTYNVGSLLRTAEGLGISLVYLTGYTAYPLQTNDSRLPHLAAKLDRQIHKTALGAEQLIDWQPEENIFDVLKKLQVQGFQTVALEQASRSIALPEFKTADKVALIVGREIGGIESEVLAAVDAIIEIPMYGDKESFNVAQAAAMALYHLRLLAN